MALAIMGIALVVLLRAVSGTLRLEQATHDYSRALAVAHARIDEIGVEDVPASRAGQTDGFRWWIAVRPVWVGGDRVQVQLYHASVIVERGVGSPLRFETLRMVTPRE